MPANTDSQTDFRFEVATEFLFSLLPFIVVGLVLWHQSLLSRFFYLPEMSLATAVLVGQAMARFIARAIKSQEGPRQVREHAAASIFAFALVFCLVPALVLLVLIQLASTTHVSDSLAVAQGIVFAWGLVVYAALSALTDYTMAQLDDTDSETPNTN